MMQTISRRNFFKTAVALSAIPLVASETKAQNTLKFIHITDSHMDMGDSDSVDAMKLMVKFVNENYKDLDFVMFGGDNFNNNVAGSKDAVMFKEIIDGLHCKTLVVRGNKESSPKPSGDSINLDEFKKFFLSDKDIKVHNKDWSYEKNGYIVLGLDSCIENANNGSYTKGTISFAQDALSKGKPTLIVNHHPYTNYWKSKDKDDIHKYVLNNTDEVQEKLFTKENLILTLSGHKHIDSVKELHGTKMVTTRGFVRPLDLDMYPMRYVELNGNKISEKLIYTS